MAIYGDRNDNDLKEEEDDDDETIDIGENGFDDIEWLDVCECDWNDEGEVDEKLEGEFTLKDLEFD